MRARERVIIIIYIIIIGFFRIMRRPRMLMHAHMHRLQHKLGRSVAALGAGTAAYHAGKQAGSDHRNASHSGSSKRTQADHSRPDGQAAPEKESVWKRAGSAVGTVDVYKRQA